MSHSLQTKRCGVVGYLLNRRNVKDILCVTFGSKIYTNDACIKNQQHDDCIILSPLKKAQEKTENYL